MNICYIADARSPIARSWISYFIERSHSVTVISSYPCAPDVLPGARVIPVPLSMAASASRVAGSQRRRVGGSLGRGWLARLRAGAESRPVAAVRRWITPLEVYRHTRRLHRLIAAIAPDLVHGLRIPYEGIAAAYSVPDHTPLLVSVWGNDFTLHAAANRLLARQTRSALRRCDGLLADCQRDLRLAEDWGLPAATLRLECPSGGGIRSAIFHPGPAAPELRAALAIPAAAPVIINPRGFRQYVDSLAVFRAFALVLRERPEVILICTGMADHPAALRWVDELGLGASVRLLSTVEQSELADLFRLAQISVSASLHDGTPNTLLEAMACGCLPVAGDIESVREWITAEVNGLLGPPDDPEALAALLLRGLGDADLRQRASAYNSNAIQQRATYGHGMQRAEAFYAQIIEHSTQHNKG